MDKYEKILDRIAEEFFRRERMKEAKEEFLKKFCPEDPDESRSI